MRPSERDRRTEPNANYKSPSIAPGDQRRRPASLRDINPLPCLITHRERGAGGQAIVAEKFDYVIIEECYWCYK